VSEADTCRTYVLPKLYAAKTGGYKPQQQRHKARLRGLVV